MEKILVLVMVLGMLVLSGCRKELPTIDGFVECYEGKVIGVTCVDEFGLKKTFLTDSYRKMINDVVVSENDIDEEMRPQYREWDSQDNVILLEGLATILDRLDTIDGRFDSLEYDANWFSSDLLKELARIESELGIYPIYVEEKDNSDCMLKMLDELLEGLDGLEYWRYDDPEQGIYYKNSEDSETSFITIYEILEENYCQLGE
jgi:hypothetical protein